jgi:hypothetical protein
LPYRNGVDEAIGGADVAAFLDDVSPAVAEFGSRCGVRRCAILPRRVMLAGKLRPAAPFHVVGQRAHGFLGDFGAFAAIDRGFRNIDSGKDFATAAFTLDPKLHRSLHGIFWTLKPAVSDGLPDKVVLFGCEVHLHGLTLVGPAQKSSPWMG